MLTLSTKHVRRMLDVAHTISQWSTCPAGKQHACVIAREGKWIVSTGYNGLATRCGHRPWCMSYDKATRHSVCKATHAEDNAVKNLPLCPTRFLFAFVTKKPCDNCMSVLKAAGVLRVYWEEVDFGGITVVSKGTKVLCTR